MTLQQKADHLAKLADALGAAQDVLFDEIVHARKETVRMELAHEIGMVKDLGQLMAQRSATIKTAAVKDASYRRKKAREAGTQ